MLTERVEATFGPASYLLPLEEKRNLCRKWRINMQDNAENNSGKRDKMVRHTDRNEKRKARRFKKTFTVCHFVLSDCAISLLSSLRVGFFLNCGGVRIAYQSMFHFPWYRL